MQSKDALTNQLKEDNAVLKEKLSQSYMLFDSLNSKHKALEEIHQHTELALEKKSQKLEGLNE